ncbi:hypothetical protein A9X00_18270 [Mycobacterium sp. 1245805.9]|nr:hypothetical protein A9X00_18270 [Mycobacterium sp. 1245805.9]
MPIHPFEHDRDAFPVFFRERLNRDESAVEFRLHQYYLSQALVAQIIFTLLLGEFHRIEKYRQRKVPIGVYLV